MKRILVITSDGYGALHALGLRDEGNEVKLYIEDERARDIYRGIFDSEKDWKRLASWPDYVFFANNTLSHIWEVLSKNKPCYGGSAAGEKLEKDRPATHKLVQSLGIKSPESLGVKTIPEVIGHLKEHKTRHVVKFTGGNTDSDDVFIGAYDDNSDLIRLCEQMEERGKKWSTIEIEEKIDGVEAGCAGYFDGTKFADGIEVNFQHKPIAASENGQGVGFLTGEMGTVMKIVDPSNPFFQRTLAKMTEYLKSVKYRGQIDMGFIVNEQGDFFIEDTTREGYPACAIQDELMKTPWGEFYWQVATGEVREYEHQDSWGIGVVLVSPGFPDGKSSARRAVGLPIYGYEENKDHCHLFEARKAKAGYEVSSGGYGLPLVVTGAGDTIEEARRNVYWLLDPRNEGRVYVPKSWWRHDIGARVLREKQKILDYGILTEKEWGQEQDEEPYMGVDLDKTLAFQGEEAEEEIGPVLPEMQKRTMDWINGGTKVKIISARASSPEKVRQIKSWLAKNGFPPLEVTNVKGPSLIHLWDDKAIEVIPNTGTPRNPDADTETA